MALTSAPTYILKPKHSAAASSLGPGPMMKKRASILGSVAALSLLLATAAAEEVCKPPSNWTATCVIRGVPKSKEVELLAQNETTSKFACGDKAKTVIPFDRVNDGFCDCPENGADEPGTSACAKGRFYCRNKGYVGEYIPSSRVDDGVCDCPDGTDERPGFCDDKCDEIAEAARAERAAQIQLNEEGAAKKKAYVKQGAEAAEKRLKDLAAAQAKKAAADDKAAAARAKASAAEALDKEKQEKLLKERAAALGKELGWAKLDAGKLTVLYSQLKGRKGRVLAEVLKEIRAKLGIKEEEPEEEEEESEVGMGDDVEDDEEDEDEVEPEPEPEPSKEEGNDLPALDKAVVAALDKAEEGVGHPSSEVADARNALYEVEKVQREATSAVTDLEKEGAMDFGDDLEFYPLKGQCFELPVQKYTYVICPYDKAEQREGANTYGTGLGKWAGMERVDASADGKTPRHFVFKFTEGQQCWNGPKRSMTVTVKCGTEDKVVAVDEPNMCTYTMDLVTPAACPPVPDHLRLELEWEGEEGESYLSRSEL